MPQDFQFTFLLLLAILFLGWFALGTHANVRRGNAVLTWLQQGLPILGERASMRWLGSSVIELKIAKGKAPFRNVETLVVFEPRDVPLLWAFERMRGRRDLLIVRAHLESSPRFEMEAFDPGGWTTHGTERNVKNKNWTRLELDASKPLQAYFSGAEGRVAAKPMIDLAVRPGWELVRLSLHRSVPNLEVHYRLPNLAAQSSQSVFSKIRQISENVVT